MGQRIKKEVNNDITGEKSRGTENNNFKNIRIGDQMHLLSELPSNIERNTENVPFYAKDKGKRKRRTNACMKNISGPHRIIRG